MLCPSTNRSETTHVLGLADSDGLVKFLPAPLPIPPEAVELLTDQDLEERVRLTGPCISVSCEWWKDGCSLGRSLSSGTCRVVYYQARIELGGLK